MTDRPETPERLSLSRWSRRKLAASAAPANAPAGLVGTAPVAPAPSAPAQSAAATESASAQLPTKLPAKLPTQLPTQLPAQLPDISSLGFDSDFTAFLRPEVDEKLKRAALKQLFRDPRFNVMDGLDTYIDDYTKADPIEPDVLADLLRRGFGTTSETGQEQPPAASVAPATDGHAPTDNAENDLPSAHSPETENPPPGEGGAQGGATVTRDGVADDQHGGR